MPDTEALTAEHPYPPPATDRIAARVDHPAVALLIARLADLSGLDFHWPKAAELRCRQLMACQRAAERCLPPAAA